MSQNFSAVSYTFADGRESGQTDQIESPQMIHSVQALYDNSEFTRNIIVNCDVRNASLTVHGNAMFKGSLIDSSIIVMGHLSVLGECLRSTMYSRGNVSLNIVRECDVFSDESAVIHRESWRSKLQVAASVYAAKAIITGGSVSAFDFIAARKVTHCTSGITSLHVGDVFLRRRKEFLLYCRMMTAEHALNVKKEVMLVHRNSYLTPELASFSKATILRIEHELADRKRAVSETRKQYIDFQNLNGSTPANAIRIHNCVEAGTEVNILDTHITLDRPYSSVQFSRGAQQKILIANVINS